ncbi:hypothetical protein Tco_1067783 [Tanacetum coccineum]|uniref:Uncharacterized protein n=1 Tax=Tanacetum coccineum TaxID=301880 RepID=A0ABQ5HFA4_9ASTR
MNRRYDLAMQSDAAVVLDHGTDEKGLVSAEHEMGQMQTQNPSLRRKCNSTEVKTANKCIPDLTEPDT